jgi:hypothetical protein
MHPFLQMTSCVHSTLHPYPDIIMQKLRNTTHDSPVHRLQQRLLRGTLFNDVALSEIFTAQYSEVELPRVHTVAQYNEAELRSVHTVAQYNEAELRRVHSVAQYIDPYEGILYCQNIIRIHGTSLNAISSMAFPVPLFTIFTISVNFCGQFLHLNLPRTERKIQKQNRQCTYNVTLRRVRVTIVDVKKQSISHSLSVCH